MSAAVYTTDLVDISTAEVTTNWTAIGTGAISAETDYFIQGAACISKVGWTAATRGQIFNYGSGITFPSLSAFIAWIEYHNPNLLDTYANGGLRLIIGSGTGAYYEWYVGGSDTIPFGGWHALAVDPTITQDATTGSPTATKQYLGGLAKVLGSGSLKGNPYGIDVMRYGRELRLLCGDTGSGYATISSCESTANSSTNRWGLLYSREGAYYVQGCMVFGATRVATAVRSRTSNVATIVTGSAHGLQTGMSVKIQSLGGTGYNTSSTTVTVTNTTTFTYSNTGTNEGGTADTGGTVDVISDFRDSDRTLFILDTPKCAAGFNEFEVRNIETRVDWTRFSIKALGTVSPGKFTVTDNGTVNLDACSFNNMGAHSYKSNTTVTGCVYNACGQINPNGGKVKTSTINGYTGATNTSALVWNDSADTNTKLDGTTFIKGSGTTHAIELGTSSPTSLTLTNVTFSGYNASDAQNDSAIHVKRTTGTVTITISGGTTPSYKTDGATVVIVTSAVSATLTVTDTSATAIQNARVLVLAASGGPMPYDVTVTIANSGTTATVTHTSHGLLTNDKVQIKGASHIQNNGVFTITKIDANSYSYTMGSAPGSNPTGTIKATFAVLSGLTDVAGQITMSRSFSSSQPISGRVRYGGSPYYKTTTLTGTVSNTTGYSATVQLLRDA